MEQVEMICDNICLLNKARMVLEGSIQEIKKRYGKNTVVLDYDGDGGFVKDLPDVAKVDDYGRSMEIKLRDNADPQSLLRSLVGRVRVNRFEIQEPSLNAIFIDNVGADHEKNTIGH
jgi:ABC-2 type transport system ATP-binding protein